VTILNPLGDCGCALVTSAHEAHIRRCSVHAAAHVLLEECRKAQALLSKYGVPTYGLLATIALAERG
jgi:hypothetical protein